jgi:hypothetical protein
MDSLKAWTKKVMSSSATGSKPDETRSTHVRLTMDVEKRDGRTEEVLGDTQRDDAVGVLDGAVDVVEQASEPIPIRSYRQ